jgi:5-methylcytosine-specific restriction endonuclease McrA
MSNTRCNTCNLDFKTNEYYKKHLITNRHVSRSTNADIITFSCVCGRAYSHHQSLYVHRKKCEKHKSIKPIAPTPTPTTDAVLKKRMESIEQDIRELRAHVAFLLDKNTQTPVHNEIKEKKDSDQIEKQDSETVLYHIKSRDKRKKINKDTRKLIADSQQNTCGECKLPLSPYYQIDHIVGLQFGGTNESSNLMALCCECHCIKSIKENQRRKLIKEAIQTILRVD